MRLHRERSRSALSGWDVSAGVLAQTNDMGDVRDDILLMRMTWKWSARTRCSSTSTLVKECAAHCLFWALVRAYAFSAAFGRARILPGRRVLHLTRGEFSTVRGACWCRYGRDPG